MLLVHFVTIVRFMRIFDILADEYRGQVTEDERLYGSYQQLEQEHEYSESNGHRHEACTYKSIDSSKDEYHADQRKDNDVARHDVGEKTYHQCHWFYEQGDKLDEYQHWLHPARHARRIEQVAPEMFLTVGQDNDERKQGKAACNCNVAGEVGAARKKTKEVIDPDKEKYG